MELNIAYFLSDSGYIIQNATFKKHGGPDFVIQTENRKIFIECARVHDASPEGKEVDKECFIDIPFHELKPGQVGMQHGMDMRKVARFASIIKDKSEKIKKYRERGIISSDDIVILVIGTDFKCMHNFSLPEFEMTIACKATNEVETRDPRGNEIGYDIEFKKHQQRFKKNGIDIYIEQKHLDQFNILVHASSCVGRNDHLPNDSLFCYHSYIRSLPSKLSQRDIINIINIFGGRCTEYNRFLYRKDRNEEDIRKELIEKHKNLGKLKTTL